MGTRATIAIKYPSKIKEVYCHWDGYPNCLGNTLYHYFDSPAGVEEIMALGDVSSLYPRLHPTPGVWHDFSSPQKNVSIFYGRDRGEKAYHARTYHLPGQEDEFLKNANHEFTYVFDVETNKWYFSEASNRFRVLTHDDVKRIKLGEKARSLDFDAGNE